MKRFFFIKNNGLRTPAFETAKRFVKFSNTKLNPFNKIKLNGTTSNHRGVILLTTIVLFLFFIVSSNVSVNAQPYPNECNDLREANGICTDFYPWSGIRVTTFNKPSDLPGCSCPMTIYYRTRGCLTDAQTVEFDIIAIQPQYSATCFNNPGIRPCYGLLNYLNTGTPDEVAHKFSVIKFEIFLAWQADINRIIIDALDSNGHIMWGPRCGFDGQDGPYNPQQKILLSMPGTCNGWCVVYDQTSFLEEYDVDIEKYHRAIPPAITSEELNELNTYFDNEVRPYIHPEMDYIPPFTALSAGPLIYVKASCIESPYCCIFEQLFCVKYDEQTGLPERDNNGKVIITTENHIYGDWQPNCDGILPTVVKCGMPAERIAFRLPCASLCEVAASYDIAALYAPYSIYFNNNSISEVVVSKVEVSPNPTTNGTMLTFEVLEAGNLNVSLIDAEGKEVMNIYNASVEAGEFTKHFSMAKFPQGVYFIKIAQNGKIQMEKLIRN